MGPVKRQAKKEGFGAVLRNAGFEWREPGYFIRARIDTARISAHVSTNHHLLDIVDLQQMARGSGQDPFAL